MAGYVPQCQQEYQFYLAVENDHLSIEVYTTSRGIPADDLKRVFNQFYRVEKSRTTSLGGSALGLTIVKRIIELHQDSITMDSEPGSWVRVRILLPVNLT